MAILYCHWLQLRWRASFMIGVSLLFSIVFGIGGWDRVRGGGDPSVALLNHLWTVFWMAPFALAMGTTLSCVYRPDYFSWSLPVSRYRWIWTRFAINGAALFLTVCIAAAVMGAWLAMQQYEVLWQTVLFSIAVGCLGILPWLAASELLNSVLKSNFGYTVAAAAVVLPYSAFMFWLSRWTREATINPQIVTNLAIFAVVGSAIMLGLAVRAAREREY